MSVKKHWEHLAILAVSILFVGLELLQWKQHPNVVAAAAVIIVVVYLLSVVLITAAFQYWRGRGQADVLLAQVDLAALQVQLSRTKQELYETEEKLLRAQYELSQIEADIRRRRAMSQPSRKSR
jgi:Flp pilus assembly protein TadB